MPSKYTVVVRGLVVLCSIGVHPHERSRLQRVRVSVELSANPAVIGAPTDLGRVVDYEKTVQVVRDIAASGHIDLCEGFAEKICEACLADSRVCWVRISVEKLDAVADVEAVGVILERSRAS